jgi:alpha-1,3-mannosylglycoprotein beta-1,4-N-acetylglucosaminyltransferase A/B
MLEFRFGWPVKYSLIKISSLGFIGKMFRSSDLPLIVQFILMFYKDKTVDWLLQHVFYVRYCSPELPIKECNKVSGYRVVWGV